VRKLITSSISINVLLWEKQITFFRLKISHSVVDILEKKNNNAIYLTAPD
jgi:hypothetical protein